MANFLLISALLAAFVVAVRYWAAPGDRKARLRATELGLLVAAVTREIPISHDRGGSYVMRRRRCIEYLLAVPHYAFEWELFQRFDKSDRRVIDGWRLDVVGVLPLSLDGALAEVRVQWTEEFLELEGSSRGIAAYWEEWGGAAQAERIHGILMALRDSTDSHGTIQQAATPDGG